MKLWQILAVVGLGVLYGLIEPGRLAYALGHATLYVFLPALLFEAAWNLNFRAMRRQWIAIATLAGPGVLLTAAIVAGALSIVRVPFGPALLAGAILSATDPIAVVAVFRRLKVPRTLATIVECESLFNDAVAVALYRGVLRCDRPWRRQRRHDCDRGAPYGGRGRGRRGVSGLLSPSSRPAYCAVVGASGSKSPQRCCARTAPIFSADYLQLSGIFATIAYGIALRYYERSWITLSIAEDVSRFWDIAALLANGLVFFMVGAGLQIARVAYEPVFAVACIAGVAVARFVVAGMLLPFPYPRDWLDVVRVAGMRGALSLALALALPASTPYREAIIDGTFAVALATLAASSLTLVPVVRRAAARQTPSG